MATQDVKISWNDYYTDPFPGREDHENASVRVTCDRCNSRGYIPLWGFVSGGVCFKCKGASANNATKTVNVGEERKKARKKAQSVASRARAKQRKKQEVIQKSKQETQRIIQAYPVMVWFNQQDITRDRLTFSDYEKSTLLDMLNKFDKYGSLSEKATEFAARLLTAAFVRTEFVRPKVVIEPPVGKVRVHGTVTKVAYSTSHYGYEAVESLRMTVLSDEGWKVNVTIPKAMRRRIEGEDLDGLYSDEYEEYPLVGKRVQFVATLKPSNSKDFMFGSRPSDLSVV